MPIHLLEREQTFAASLKEVWRFFATPLNLARITPETLGFEVRSKVPAEMHAGLLIEYRIRPFWGIRMTWLTEITQVQPMRYFVDEQRVGPYRLWHHEHLFEETEKGQTRMIDRVTYALPFGWLSEPVHRLVARPQLERIFEHRRASVGEFFGAKEK